MTILCKCTACGRNFVLTMTMELQASREGFASSPCCNVASTVERATTQAPESPTP